MKRIFAFLLAFVLCASMCACNKDQSSPSSAENQAVTLTKENIHDYVLFSGEYVDYEYHKSDITRVATASLDFQAKPKQAGSFNDVRIMIRIDIEENVTSLNKWKLEDDEDPIMITIQLSADGTYEHSYSLEGPSKANELAGACNFEIISVKGTFTQSNN